MPFRLVALDEGADIPIGRDMLVVGRHPQCDARLDSIRVSRRHCCLTDDSGEVVVRDLGSTNGIRINGQRVEKGRLRVGDELSIAHIRFRLDDGQGQEMSLAEPAPGSRLLQEREPFGPRPHGVLNGGPSPDENPLAMAVRDMLPPGMADRCRIQVIVQMQPDAAAEPEKEPHPPAEHSSPR
jgi:hypothetical protein